MTCYKANLVKKIKNYVSRKYSNNSDYYTRTYDKFYSIKTQHVHEYKM